MEVDGDTPNLSDYASTNGVGRSITNNTEVIETIDISDYPVNKKKSRLSNAYNKDLCRDNQPLTDFINKCLLLDRTNGMETVINKVLLPSYVKADKEYKESDRFRRVVTKAFKRLIDDPDRKYTHISDVVDTLKFHVETPPQCKVSPVKKRVNFITLSTKVSVKPNDHDRKRPMIQSSSRECPPKKSKSDIIALDCDDDDEVVPIEDEVHIGKKTKISKENDKSESKTEKETVVNCDTDTIEIQDSQELKITEGNENEHPVNELIGKSNAKNIDEKNNTIEHEKENLGSNENLLLVPHKEKIVRLEKPKLKKKVPPKRPEEMTEDEKARRIKIIEAKIEKHNKTIAKLDLEEVTDDSANSPYHKCDLLRAAIVKLYKELCTLVGEEPPKRRKIQLQIKEGVPQGPIKRLEKFLNKRMDDEGETPFPDFSDVVRCVEKANEADNLGWSKAKIMKEAQSIFTYCGRALQKKRQQREWKHLRALARPEEFEADPAETDLELQARLEANRRLASQREAEVFNKFSQLEDTPEPAASTSVPQEPSDHEDCSTDEETEPTHPTILKESDPTHPIILKEGDPTHPTILKESERTHPTVLKESDPTHPTILKESEPTHPTILKESNNNDSVTHNVKETEVVVKQEPDEVPIKIQYQGDISLVINISDSESEDECGVLTF
ncbi:titin homolog isoform X3 [Leguminivora glycinivorella]|uniref:titin homolog isoform X3 n=1 Tax=Leguminivora glycinivorella TaxID=1035111 RepID=UPI00201029CD|nr:titin homolog isoform X3 [Leguminivora glycinivorella]